MSGPRLALVSRASAAKRSETRDPGVGKREGVARLVMWPLGPGSRAQARSAGTRGSGVMHEVGVR
jgi:hypothetical protein